MRMLNKISALAIVLTLCSFALSEPEKITIYLIGDSTVCTQPLSQAPVTGWGTPFAVFFDKAVKVENHAKGAEAPKLLLVKIAGNLSPTL